MTNYNAAYLSDAELRTLPFKMLGTRVLIDKTVSLVDVEKLSIGDDVRIDAGCVLVATGGISIGSCVHVSAHAYLAGRAGIDLHDFAGLSTGVQLYSVNDDYTGGSLTNPTVPEQYKKLSLGRVIVGRHAIIGAGSIVLPGVEVGEGCAISSLSFVRTSTEPWSLYAGVPARRLRERSRELLTLEAEFRDAYSV